MRILIDYLKRSMAWVRHALRGCEVVSAQRGRQEVMVFLYELAERSARGASLG